MSYINDEKLVKIRNALAVILRTSFSNKRESRVENTAREIGKIDKLCAGKRRNTNLSIPP
jgi:hypothetical protein